MTYQPPEGYQPSPDYDPTKPDAAYPTEAVEAAPPAADHRDEVRRQALDDVRHTRTRAAWVGLIVGALVTLILLIFIVQNLDSQNIDLFFWTVNLPVGVSLLIAAILGAVITAIVGSLRMLQVRRAVKKARP
ncbi:LapA family protein [Williamsia soli]|uniref:LapA family protein n=1 Tax=Williamsia soli TaxID=364929 RepID=UPI001A9EFFFB|nr:lipopolysaccharide assembly protein LapA domain-containing protein [Williamsia soli]